jgi:hypothetical protein
MHKQHILLAFAALTLLAIVPARTSAEEPDFIKGHDRGSFTATALTATVVRTHDVGDGYATVIGAYHMVANENVNLANLEVTNASFTITTKNGDTLTGTYTGKGQMTAGSATGITYYVSGPITGGTGRFAGITGAIAFFGKADLATGKFEDVIVSVIADAMDVSSPE